jgi:hypothetical protein
VSDAAALVLHCLRRCVEVAGDSFLQKLNGTTAVQTLFAPSKDALEGLAVCDTAQHALEFVNYLASPAAGSLLFIGKEFPTLAGASAWFYGITMTADVPVGVYSPIQYINNANITEIRSVGPTATLLVIDRCVYTSSCLVRLQLFQTRHAVHN